MMLFPGAGGTDDSSEVWSFLSDPIKMYLGDIYTISVNLAGLPGICLPCGVDSKGLPIGLQLIGDCFKEKEYHPCRPTLNRQDHISTAVSSRIGGKERRDVKGI